MRTQAFASLTCGVLLLGGVLAACGATPDNSAGTGSFAGATSAAGASNTAGAAPYVAGASNSAGAPSAGAPSVAGAPGAAGAPSGVAGSESGGAPSGGASSAGAGGAPGAAGTNGAAGSGGAATVPAVKFVVYIDDYTGSWTSWAGKTDFSKVTHLNLAFFKATTGNDWASVDGQSDADIKAIVDKAHAAGVKVLASLGGGGTDTTVSTQYKDPTNDDALVSNLDAFLKRLNLDGADIDIEKESTADVGPNYGTFVAKVVAKLHPEGKLVTAAVAQYLQGYMPDDTLKSFDFVNIMIYSSNTSDYTSALNFYVGKGMPKNKLVLGLISESGTHTSVATATSLSTMSKSWGGGMLWDLAEDSTGSASVYKAMQAVY
jgi:chitinase